MTIYGQIFTDLYGEVTTWAKGKPWKGDFANGVLNSYEILNNELKRHYENGVFFVLKLYITSDKM